MSDAEITIQHESGALAAHYHRLFGLKYVTGRLWHLWYYTGVQIAYRYY